MHCLFVVPHLFWPDPEVREAYADLSTPALELLFGRGRKRIAAGTGLEGWLVRAFAFPEDEALPVAPFRLAGDGGAPGDDAWLCADPVHLRVDRDRLVLAEGEGFAPDAAETEALLATFNAHFAEDGLAFVAPTPGRWYLRTPNLPETPSPSLREARGRAVHALFGDSAADGRWRALANEIQMLLHEHPVNVAREDRRAPAINGLWLWGGGRWRTLSVSPISRWLTSDPLVSGLARAASHPVGPIPTGFEALERAGSIEGVVRIVLEEPEQCVARGDLDGWRQAVASLEQRWFAPALEALRAKRIGMISVHAVGDESTLHAETTAGDLRYFWRRPRSLATYVNA